MNTTEYFKRTIQAYLEERAMEDELFAAKYDNPDKNIDDCVTYILNWVLEERVATAFAMTKYMGKPSTTTRRRTSRSANH